MEIKFFNFWYFFWIAFGIGCYIGLYHLLKNRTDKTKKFVLFSILIFALVLHFLKSLIPPYSLNQARLYRDIFFINICGANIALFPFIFISKSEKAKDYMFYLGVLSGLLATIAPIEPLENSNQVAEWLDTIRFYLHHTILWVVPLLMVTLKLHTLNYKRVFCVPTYFMAVLLFIMVNQILQSELGFIPLRNDNFFDINYKNSSMIWNPTADIPILTALCPKIFKTVPVGPYKGQLKYWPWFWLLVPAYIYLPLLSFIIALIFDHQSFLKDFNNLKQKIMKKLNKQTLTINSIIETPNNIDNNNINNNNGSNIIETSTTNNNTLNINKSN